MRWLCVCWLLIGLINVNAHGSKVTTPEAAARGVLTRLIGERAQEFELQCLPAHGATDRYEMEASGGVVVIRGTSSVAIAHGAYDYLRRTCGAMVSWSGNRLDLPRPLPDQANVRVTSPYPQRLFLNVCTFGYTTAFWDWERWEKELDWLALHGMNMPLAMVGQELIWQRIWRDMGFSQAELDDYFTGPAFLPWHRLGNINKHAGPLPQGWIDGQAELQKKILKRMRELGMDPIVPAFAGFVPPGMKRLRPEAQIYDMNSWCGFSKEDNTYLLDPTSPLFQEIGTRFIKAYRDEFGPARYYLADSFNEMVVPVTPENRYQKLADFGEGVYRAIAAGDPDGVWVMEGWIFSDKPEFWDTPSTQALLSRVPDDRMIIIDLGNERYHGWEQHDGFYGKQWIYSVFHNFGGNKSLRGKLPFYASDPIRALNANKGKQVGYGISPEGLENNEAAYELLTDMGWTTQPIQMDAWLDDYCRRRYGACPPAMQAAWKEFTQSVYGHDLDGDHYCYQLRPSLRPGDSVRIFPAFKTGLDHFLECADELGGSPLYLEDLRMFTLHYLGGAIDERLRLAVQAHAIQKPDERDRLAADAIQMIKDADALLAGSPTARLEPWLSYARKWGRNETEADFYEANARRQITVWGGPELSEYACKVWHGMLAGYYAPRWEMFFDGLRSGKPADILAWEEKWINATEYHPMAPSQNVIADAQKLIQTAAAWQDDADAKSIKALALGEQVGGWDAGAVATEHATLEWNISDHLAQAGTYEVRFRFAGGRRRFEVLKVELLGNGLPLAVDEHRARVLGIEVYGTGDKLIEESVYRIALKQHQPGTQYALRVSVAESNPNKDSIGEVWLRKVKDGQSADERK